MFIYQRVNTPKLIWHNSYRQLGQMDMVPYSMWCTDEMSQEVVGFCFQVITLVVGDHIQNLSGLVLPGNLPETGDFTMIFHEKKSTISSQTWGFLYVCSFKFMTIHDHLRWQGFFQKKWAPGGPCSSGQRSQLLTKKTFQKTNQSSESSFQIDYIIIPSCEYL